PVHATGGADAVLQKDRAERLAEVETRLGDPPVEHHGIAARGQTPFDRHLRALAKLERVGTDLAPAVGPHGRDVRVELEVSGRLGLELDLAGHSGAIAGPDVDGDGVVVEG